MRRLIPAPRGPNQKRHGGSKHPYYQKNGSYFKRCGKCHKLYKSFMLIGLSDFFLIDYQARHFMFMATCKACQSANNKNKIAKMREKYSG